MAAGRDGLSQAGVTWLLAESRRQATELHTSIEETEDMNTSDRGLKHVCPECATKYYDLGKEVVACPRCGAKPPAAINPKAKQPAKKTGRTTSRRYR
jgi:DNA-directed RNA polymerase subunit RPC12/RpoP